MSLVYNFSQFVNCLFTQMSISFNVKKLLNKQLAVVNSFENFPCSVIFIHELFAYHYVFRNTSTFSFMKFTVSVLPFRSLIHFDFRLLHADRRRSSFSFQNSESTFLQVHLSNLLFSTKHIGPLCTR